MPAPKTKQPAAQNAKVMPLSGTRAEAQASAGHDHTTCLQASIERAEKAFETRGLRLTDLRRLVLEEIANSHKAIGAYDLLERLQRKTGKRMAPISVYRALDALLELELVHRIESRNAFVACHTAHKSPDGSAPRHLFLVCESCDLVTEIDGTAVVNSANATARNVGFQPARTVIETTGRCAECATRPANQR
ncbi:MAG: hypothetical protein RL291_1589 [Pseudomonadota bacterium]